MIAIYKPNDHRQHKPHYGRHHKMQYVNNGDNSVAPESIIIRGYGNSTVSGKPYEYEYKLLSGPWGYDGKENYLMDKQIVDLESSGIKCETRNFPDGIYVYRTARGWKE